MYINILPLVLWRIFCILSSCFHSPSCNLILSFIEFLVKAVRPSAAAHLCLVPRWLHDFSGMSRPGVLGGPIWSADPCHMLSSCCLTLACPRKQCLIALCKGSIRLVTHPSFDLILLSPDTQQIALYSVCAQPDSSSHLAEWALVLWLYKWGPGWSSFLPTQHKVT